MIVPGLLQYQNMDTGYANLMSSFESEINLLSNNNDKSANSLPESCSAQMVINVFNQTFADSALTVLEFGGNEPVYFPAGCAENPGPLHRILFAHGFVSSALHEIAHWCIAGEKRRQLVDYGYWYFPDGRNKSDQKKFELVEAKPQALEWHLSVVCGVKFHVSFDNLCSQTDGQDDDSALVFKRAVVKQAISYQQHGLPPRAKKFVDAVAALRREDGLASNGSINKDYFVLSSLT